MAKPRSRNDNAHRRLPAHLPQDRGRGGRRLGVAQQYRLPRRPDGARAGRRAAVPEGQRRDPHRDRRAPRDPAPRAPQPPGPHGGQGGLRPRGVRGLHGPPGRRAGGVVPHARRRRCRPRGHDRGGPGHAGSDEPGPGGLRRGRRAPVRVLHAGPRGGLHRPPARSTLRRASTRSRTAWPGTSAAAAPTRASSRPCRRPRAPRRGRRRAMAQQPRRHRRAPKVTFTVKAGHASDPQSLVVHVAEGDLQPWDLDTKLAVVKGRHTRLDGPDKVTGKAKYTFDLSRAGDALGKDGPRHRARGRDRRHRHVEGGGPARREGGVDHRVAHGALRGPGRGRGGRGLARGRGGRRAPGARDLRRAALRHRAAGGPGAGRAPGLRDAASSRPTPRTRPKTLPRKGNVVGPNVPRATAARAGDIDKGFAEADAVVEATYHVPVHTHCSARDARCRRAMGRGDAHHPRLHPGRLRGAQRRGGGPGDRPQERHRDHRAHGRGLRQQARPLRHRQRVRGGGLPPGQAGGRAGEADARPPRGAPLHGQRAARAHDGAPGGEAGRHLDGPPPPRRSAPRGSPTARAAAAPRAALYQDCPNARIEDHDVFTNAGPAAPLRAPGHPQGAFALESAVDELAHKLGMDPLDLRRKNESSPVRRIQHDDREPRPSAGSGGTRSRARAAGRRSKRGIGDGQRQLVRDRSAAAAWPRRCRIHRDGGVELLPGRAGHRHRLPHRDGGRGGGGAGPDAGRRQGQHRRHPAAPRARARAAATPRTRWPPRCGWPPTPRA